MGSLLILNAYASITPEFLERIMKPCETITETKIVDLPAVIPKGDVVFAFDLTGSMSGVIATAKAQALAIMAALNLLISDAQYGVMSFMDYPHYYEDYYGYSAEYGYGSDYAYRLDQAVTDDETAVATAINNLVLGYGSDGPQDYTRIMYESYADPAVGWRTGARRILVLLCDNVPHDDNLNEGIGGDPVSTGGDPGRDEEMMTSDDLDLQTVLGEMASNNVVLLAVRYGMYAFDYWTYWTGLTGGAAISSEDAEDIPELIEALVEATAGHIDSLTLVVQEPEYEAWLTCVDPPEYTDIDLPAERVFEICITVPCCTPPGVYIFHITAVGDGADYGEQTVIITVPPEAVIPEVPFGTIVASASMIMGLLGFFLIPRFKRKQSI